VSDKLVDLGFKGVFVHLNFNDEGFHELSPSFIFMKGFGRVFICVNGRIMGIVLRSSWGFLLLVFGGGFSKVKSELDEFGNPRLGLVK
jgi:hypothetical protein